MCPPVPPPASTTLRRALTVAAGGARGRWRAPAAAAAGGPRAPGRALELVDMVCVPLVADGRILGVLTLGSDRRRGPLTAADVEV
ncbi:GAF domain-containing protein, partial [Geodermatophilus sp. DF01_2]|uniref:GAF domain-containing protein n=1 Tax=Geodermatophilus sp. DF01-2 TaxID=2559610 RepID=UPI001FD855CF